MLVYFTYLTDARSHHIRHHRDRFKRQQGAHLYLPGSYVTDGDDEPDAGPWLEWSSPSQCSRTCGGGVSSQYRQCTSGHRCRGPTSRHFSCNTQDCPDLADFRALQCAEFNTIPFEGTLYEWVPYTKSPQPCELNCMPRGERFYYRHKLQVVDGTKCSDESLDVCVEGKCQPVGCDMMLGSDAREDQCRVCEGDGSTCNTMSGLLDMQDLQVGYNDVLLIPSGAVNIKVREVDRSNNYLAIRNASGHYYLNGNWRIDFPRTIELAGTKFHYERSPQGFSAPDTLTSLGPIEESLFIVLLYQDRNVGIHYEYSIPKTVQHPSSTETYAWTFDQFTPCSASCGGGVQFRNVSCAGRKSLDPVDPNLCDANNKPVETQRCGEIPCDPKWVAKDWEKCSATCGDGGTQTRKIYCEQIISGGVASIVDDGQCVNLQKPPIQQECNKGVICGEWHIGPWKPCNRLCGKGKEARDVICYRKVDGKITVLNDSECPQKKPETSRSCLLRPCEGVDWVASEWSGCENKCGLSEETRMVQCMTAAGEVFSDKLCEQDEKKPETSRKCVSKAGDCIYEWYASQWSECSAKCGSGVQTRKVFCTKPTDDGFKKVESSNCDPLKKYDAVQNCTAAIKECPGEWFTGPWTKCTKDCNGGLKTRKVLCIKGNSAVHVKECDPELTPSSSEECNKQACDTDEVMPVDKITRVLPVTTEEAIVLETDDEYEIVEADECEDGEWVDTKNVPQRKLGPSEKYLSAVSKSLGESTDTDSIKLHSEISLADDDLMLRDAPVSDSYVGDAESGQLAAVDQGSGDDATEFATDASLRASGFTFDEGSGVSEGSGDDILGTEVTETIFKQTFVYTFGSPITTDEFETTDVTDPDETIVSESGTEMTESELGITGATIQEPVTEITDVIELSSESEPQPTLVTQYVSTEETELSTPVSKEITEPTEITDEASEITSKKPATDVSSEEPPVTSEKLVTVETEVTEGVTEVTGISSEKSVVTSEETLRSTEITSEEPDLTSEEVVTIPTIITSEQPELTSEEVVTVPTIITSEQPELTPEEVVTVSTIITSEQPELTSEEETPKEKVTTKEPEATSEKTVTDITEAAKVTPASEATDETVSEITEKSASEVTEETASEVTVTEEIISPKISVSLASAVTEDISELPSKLPQTTEAGKPSEIPITTETDIEITTAEEATVEVTIAPVTKETKITEETTVKVEETTTTKTSVTKEAEITEEPTVKVDESTTRTSIITEKESTEEATDKVEETTAKTSVPQGTEITEEATIEESTTKVSVTKITEIIEETTDEIEESTTKASITKEIEVTEEEDEVTTKVKVTEPTTKESTEVTEEETFGTEESIISTTVATVISRIGSMFTKFTSIPEELTTASTTEKVITSKTENVTTATTVTETGEEVTEGTTEYDIWSSTEGTTRSTATSSLIEIFTAAKPRFCKRRRKPTCKRSEFGCCPDKITPAKGPFDKGCPIQTTCEETKFGCCEDGVSPATGKHFKGCPVSQCDQTLFGCCPDNKTPSQGNNNEGCPPPPPECLKSKFGCCEDNATEALGPNGEGCTEKEEYTTEEIEELSTTTTTTAPETTTEQEDCSQTTYGCCPDLVSVAQGDNYKGCDLIYPTDCTKSSYGCCPDKKTAAEGPRYQGCEVECLKNVFGCCDDGITPAHGYSKEGCCLNTEFGCCPDNIKPAEGPKLEGCGCAFATFGCCPDNVTHARGSNKEGCGCQYTQHGCCPDNHAEAQGPDYEGCPCNTFQFGCCPDGVTPAKGLRNEGCGCAYSEFGCCSDEKTPASGPNFAGCDCLSSKYGCCPDGTTEAQGEDFEGCLDAPENLQAHCQLTKDRGTCRNYTVRWFYDMEYGGCSRFWYGGCDGNGNRFKSKEDCHNVCVEPSGKDRCNLPKVVGPCEGYYPQWHYNKDRNECEHFVYGGCLGNNNRFETREECSKLCVADKITDTCQQPPEPGPCRGDYINWFYNNETGYCEQFIYGGCQGNDNNFPTQAACTQRCAGDKKLKQTCELPADVGDCSDYVSRYYYDTKHKACKHFYYGGCGGNKNNFISEGACLARCRDGLPETEEPPQPPAEVTHAPTEGPEPFRIEYCYLPPEVGPCRKAEARWHYSNDGTCRQFTYGGCEGNKNNFKTSDECSQMCGNAEDVCNLPMTTGPCHADYPAYYYNKTTNTCELFTHGGCIVHGNKFTDLESCERRCKKAPSTTYAPEVQPTYDPSDPRRVCLKEVEAGNCNETIHSFYYDPMTLKCTTFIYTGCGGNENRFASVESCERYCGKYRGHDVCALPYDIGPCRAMFPKYYYDISTGTCRQFSYGGCEGNANRFSTIDECYSTCGSRQPVQQPEQTTAISAIAETRPQPQPEPEPELDICKQYRDECSKLRCQYGMKGYVENLCNRCKCVDPCEGIQCPEGTRCEVELNRNQVDTSDVSTFVGLCKEINKAGDCPFLRGSGEDCREDCQDDADCLMDLKCCSNGCGHVCVMPSITTFAPPAELRTTVGYAPEYTQRPIDRGTYAPEIIEEEFQPVVTAGEGDYATLKCAIRGNPKPVFTWSKNNVLIDGKEPRYRILLEGAALQIISLYKTDAGVYLCSADNNIGNPLQKEIKLEVIDPVNRTTGVIDDPELSNIVVSLGSPAMLNCYAYGYPPPIVMWWKDNEFVPFKSHEYTISKDHTLLINAVRLHNLGVYTCQAYNGIGKATSWSVTVQTIGPVYSTNVEDRKYMKYVIDRQPRTTPHSQHPPTPYTIESSSTISTTPFPTTVVPTAPRIYTVPVRANITLANTNYPIGSDINVPCDVEGYPIPTVQWYKDGKPLAPSRTVQITESHRLIIKNATDSDSGEYRCAAWNQYSNATSTIPLLVQGRFIHPSCKDNPFFANCPLIIKANFCSHKYYARFCCRSCTEAGKLPSVGPHLRPDSVQNDVA
ncbi:hypothetical protein Trydic_g2060 [Trypoxylus dichotomus]